MLRKYFAAFMVMMLVFCYMPFSAYAESNEAATNQPEKNFSDMPNDWSKEAIEHAVSNGLLNGYQGEEGLYINPKGTLTRAEMATIANRAFGAQEKASTDKAEDISKGSWYEPEIAKAVQMGTMKIDNQMRPNANVTRQEAFTILARAFKLKNSSNAGLEKFSDHEAVAAWAKDSVSALVEHGYVAGSSGYLNPAANITRAEMAKIMDNIVKQYISSEGIVENVVEKGNVMVNVPGVTLKNITINGNLIIGDGVGTGEITLENVTVTGETVVRGGGVNSFIIKGDSSLGNVIIAKVNGNVRIAVEGNANVSVVFIDDGKDDVMVEGKIGTLKIEADTPVMLKKAEIANVEVNVNHADLTISKDATVTSLKVDSAEAALSISGTVKTLSVAKDATGAKLEITKDAKVTTLEANTDVTTSGDGKANNTTGSGTVKSEAPASGSSGSSSGGGGGSSSPAPSSTALTDVAVNGTKVIGQTLTAAAVPSGATASYQWMRCDTVDGTYTNISGATSATYTLTDTDAGKYIKVTSTGTGSYTGTQTSATTVVVGIFATPIDYSAPGGGLLGVSNTVSLSGTTFANAASVADLSNWTIDTGTTNLTPSSITRTGDHGVTIDYTLKTADQGTGTGTITIQAKAAAVTANVVTNTTAVEISGAAISPYGTGTTADPWKVMTIEDLASIGKTHAPTGQTWALSDSYILMNHLDFNDDASYSTPSAVGSDWNGDGDSTATIKAQMTTGVGWLPIADNTQFSGHFDGNGKTISNLYINRPSDDYQSLFGASKGAAIESLGIVGADVTGCGEVSALVSDAVNTDITFCSATGAVNGSNMYLGGLVGWFGGESGGAPDLSFCYTDVDVTGTGTDADYVGGLAGGFDQNSTITGCYSMGDVDGDESIGGLSGSLHNGITIINSYATGAVTGKTQLGGLVGNATLDCVIRDCYSLGSVDGDTVSDSYVGGLLGFSDEREGGNVTVMRCIVYSPGITGKTNLGRILGGIVDLSFVDTTLSSNYAYIDMQVNTVTASALSCNIATNNGGNLSAMNIASEPPISSWDMTEDNTDADNVYWKIETDADRPVLYVYKDSAFTKLGPDTGLI